MTYIIAEPCIDIKDKSCVEEAFVPINYAFADPAKINALVDEYATEHNVQNPPLEER
jgi:hypothetical protein